MELSCNTNVDQLQVYKKAGLAPNADTEPAEATATTAPTATTATAATATKRLSSGSAANSKPAKKAKKGGESDAEDIDDVTKIAGVDMEEEENAILDDLQGDDEETEDQEEQQFCNFMELKYRIATVARKNGLRNVAVEACQYLAFSMQQQLRDMLENVVRNSHHRAGVYRPHLKSTHDTYDPNPQLRMQQRLFAGRVLPRTSGDAASERTGDKGSPQQHSRASANAHAGDSNTPLSTAHAGDSNTPLSTANNSTSAADDESTGKDNTSAHTNTNANANANANANTNTNTNLNTNTKAQTVTNTHDDTSATGDPQHNATTATASANDNPVVPTRTIKLCDLLEYMESNAALRSSKLLYASYLKRLDESSEHITAELTATAQSEKL
ncbi:hypothetical protein SARC_05586 [Sphaeroforma arctica JP610]|uniref:Transcription initiation factor TFIID component TAF4 C-terminal domain-containing protein n=1 Tax=Sphaeroforma arctica JP610 TaxID=667725 RepID=A0A0L0FZ69_9EUKA|nr:hypothetical protein SARC_05586 [Sphaeroforma arctica JP610]KNC82117.1 hypothetical protein SARC_05586 [Sphaeroforma arctica JP610]|eukprot:XP_014156019.1 hypothetical protein SARC_05586 [Sphaeroforma arctica JP610]